MTEQLRADDEIAMVGIIQEQHPDRNRLFMQWKGMDWPIMVDSLNLLEMDVVPYHVLIDEAGVVVEAGARPGDLEAFLAREPASHAAAETPTPRVDRVRSAHERGEASAGDLATALYLWGDAGDLDEVIELYGRALERGAAAGPTNFRLGVAHRARFESDSRRDGDFAAAIERWGAALDVDPNQYIWRRRIQQYGPRLDKPYPFYDWVDTAREEIRARGEEPLPLRVEPKGAELTRPSRHFDTGQADLTEPDPDDRITRDTLNLIETEVVVAPATRARSRSARVHLIMRPNAAQDAHWNNEVEPTEVWLRPPEDWTVDSRRLVAPMGEGAVSTETRTLEFEVRPPEGWDGGTETIPAYALVYACEGADGVCLYLREDIDIEVKFPER